MDENINLEKRSAIKNALVKGAVIGAGVIGLSGVVNSAPSVFWRAQNGTLTDLKSSLSFKITIEGSYWDNQAICVGVAPSGSAITITKVQATTIGSSTPTLTYNIEERAYASYNSAGTDIFAADKTADSNGDEQTSFSNAGIAASAGLFLTTGAGAESGTVTGLVLYIEYTVG